MSDAKETALARPAAHLEPVSFKEVSDMSHWIADSGLGGKVWRSPGTAAMAILSVRALGLSASKAMDLHVIEGRDGEKKLAYPASLLHAACLNRRDLCKYFRAIEITDTQATFETWREGTPEPTRFTFTVKDAERAGLLKNPTWQRWPKQMLASKCISGLARLVYPDTIAGCYTLDEVPEAAQSRPSAPIEGELEPVSPEETIRVYLAQIEASQTLSALAEVGQALKGEPQAVKGAVRGAYKIRQGELAAPPAAPPAAPDTVASLLEEAQAPGADLRALGDRALRLQGLTAEEEAALAQGILTKIPTTKTEEVTQ